MGGTLNCIAKVTAGYFVATVRSISSTPTVYVDEVSAALRFYQDNAMDRLDVEFANGRRTSFQSHLFTRAELLRLSVNSFEVEEVRGLDLFHLRFARDPRWNPPTAAPLARLSQELERLEEQVFAVIPASSTTHRICCWLHAAGGRAQMSQFLNSPFAIGFCLVALLAWVLMLCALFWPPTEEQG